VTVCGGGVGATKVQDCVVVRTGVCDGGYSKFICVAGRRCV
jgi:hypothetical protein